MPTTLIVVGHNPGLQHFALRLAGAGSDANVFKKIEAKFPTAALARFTVEGDWANLDFGGARLTHCTQAEGSGHSADGSGLTAKPPIFHKARRLAADLARRQPAPQKKAAGQARRFGDGCGNETYSVIAEQVAVGPWIERHHEAVVLDGLRIEAVKPWSSTAARPAG